MCDEGSAQSEEADEDRNQITDDTAFQRCQNIISDAFSADDPVLVDALPAMGKSRGVIRWAAETGHPLTIFTARHELYDQYGEWCDDFGLTVKQLPSFHNDCPTANGELGDERRGDVLDAYNRGLSASEIHRRDDEVFDNTLPCQQENICPYMDSREFNPEDYDVLVGYYTHSHRPQRLNNRYVVFDEFPQSGFLDSFSSDTVTSAISTYLAETDELPFENWRDFERNRNDPERQEAIGDWIERHGGTNRDIDVFLSDGAVSAHARAPIMIYAFLESRILANGWEYAELGEGRVAVRSPVDDTLTVLQPPILNQAASVIALDGTPTVEKWRLLLGENLRHRQVLSDDERRDYLRTVLNLRFIQTTEHPKPYASGEYVTPASDMALFEAIRKREGQVPALISSRQAINQYIEEGLEQIVEDIGEMTEHYNNLKGSNKFATTRLGIVAGCPQPPDEEVQKWCALNGESVEREEGTRGQTLDFGELGNKMLQSFRENEVFQAAMRFGRQAEDGDRGATVYIHTSAIPDWLNPEEQIADITTWEGQQGGMPEVIQAIKDQENWQTTGWRTSDIHSRVDISIQQVRSHLRTLEEYGYLQSSRANERGRPYVWSNVSLEEAGTYGHVEFG